MKSKDTNVIAAEAKLVLLGEVNNELCVLCGVPLGPGEDTVCTLHALQVASGEVQIAQTGCYAGEQQPTRHNSFAIKPGNSGKSATTVRRTNPTPGAATKARNAGPKDPSAEFAFEFDRIDKNKDGWLSPSELHQGLLACGWDQDRVCGLFEQIDVNGDGKVTKAEYISFRAKAAQANAKAKKSPGAAAPAAADAKGAAAADAKGYLSFEFDRIDKNKDGWLSPSELHQGLLSAGWKQDDVSHVFDLIDTNKDGRITKAEFIAFKSSPWGGR